MIMSVALYLFLQEKGWSIVTAAYLSIIVGAVMVTTFEWYLPYRRQWWPHSPEMVQDALYMGMVQGVLPKILSVTLVILVIQGVQETGLSLVEWWPTHWSVPFQMLLMMGIADGLRYWLHRWAHEWEPLWRFHAVHHAPHKLYWLNVGRFHPVDKSLQFLLDTLPFMIIGVPEAVLALYLVCYAVNGFFQHSNVNLHLGIFNYLISGPELHRWHHSKWKEESNHNYGNNLIVWDLLFGTWYWPREREVGELGLINRDYPESFLEQMAAPLTPGLDKQGVSG